MLLMRAQRLNLRLPQGLKSALRSLLESFAKNDGAEIGLKDWSTPLISGPSLGSNGWTNTPPQRVPHSSTDDAVIDTRPQRHWTKVRSTGGLRCLLVSPSLDVGGVDEVVVFLARRLRERGIYVAVLNASLDGTHDGVPRGRLGRFLVTEGVETVELSAPAGARWLADWRPDVISAHGVPTWVLEEACALSIPCVDTLHGMHSLFEADPAAVAERGRYLAGIIAVSDLIRSQYLKLNPSYPENRIVTIPNGVDDSRRRPMDRERVRTGQGITTEYIFLSLGRHCLQKNTYGLLGAFQEVANENAEAHLVVAGRPDDNLYLTQVMRLRESLKCRERIHLCDHHPNPAELLALADGFVLDSFFEGWSLASMEALYAGLPVVLSEVAGAKEQVGTGEVRGYLVPNPIGDPLQVNWRTIREARFARQTNRDALVTAMTSLIKNRKWWLAEKQRLINESTERFNPDLCISRHADVLIAAANAAKLEVQTLAPR